MTAPAIRTRFAPSPTGALHLGGARTALCNWLFARHAGGAFMLRIEDTDRQRSTEANRKQILDALEWLGLDWDGEVVRQSERAARHREILQMLLDRGHAYYCDCTPERLDRLRQAQLEAKSKPRYDRHCRDLGKPPSAQSVVRFKTSLDGEISIRDGLKGTVTYRNDELDDLVIARADGSPTYHLAVVADDWDAGITHIIRGDDHLNNTPRQIHIFRALGAPEPQYVHLPMILDAQGRKLSKRDEAADVMQYRQQGYLPTALVNALARLGWAHGDDELFSRDELVRKFGLDGLNPAASRLDPKKLDWINQQQIGRVERDELDAEFAWHCAAQGMDANALDAAAQEALLQVQRQRCRNMADMASQSRWLLEESPAMDEKAARKFLTAEAIAMLRELRTELAEAAWTAEALQNLIQAACERHQVKPGKIAQPLRVAVTGSAVSPSIEDTLLLLGRTRAMQRLDAIAARPQ